jgi:hypothetical protein
MTTMTQSIAPFPSRHHHFMTTASLVVLFWLVAATLVVAVRIVADAFSTAAGSIATIAALLASAWAWARFTSRQSGLTHALGVGCAWLALSIAAEVIIGLRIGEGWSMLIGSPDQPFLRNIVLFTWIFAPALFARRKAD